MAGFDAVVQECDVAHRSDAADFPIDAAVPIAAVQPVFADHRVVAGQFAAVPIAGAGLETVAVGFQRRVFARPPVAAVQRRVSDCRAVVAVLPIDVAALTVAVAELVFVRLRDAALQPGVAVGPDQRHLLGVGRFEAVEIETVAGYCCVVSCLPVAVAGPSVPARRRGCLRRITRRRQRPGPSGPD